MTQESMFGPKLPYDPNWNKPWGIERKVRDPIALIFFILCFFLWVGSGFFAIVYLVNAELLHINYHENDQNWYYRYHSDDHEEEYNIGAVAILLSVIVLISGIITVILSITFLYYARNNARVITWCVINFCMVVLSILAMLLMMVAMVLPRHKYQDAAFHLMLLAIFNIICVCICICMTVIWRKKVNIAAEIIAESSKAILDVISVLVVTTIESFVLWTIIIFFIVVTICMTMILLNASDDYKKDHSDTLGVEMIAEMTLLLNFFGFFWALFFYNGMFDMIVSGSIATWYWTMDKSLLIKNIVSKSCVTTIKYHLGSVAFGSLLITIVQIIKLAFKKSTSEEHGAVEAVGDTLLNMVDRLLQYINGNAYVICIVHGTDFIDSAKFAFNLIMRNAAQAFVTSQATGAVICVIQLGIVMFVTLLATIIILVVESSEYLGLLIIVFLSALCVSSSIFGALQIAVTTIGLSFMEDSERNEGTPSKPYYMGNRLRQLMDEVDSSSH